MKDETNASPNIPRNRHNAQNAPAQTILSPQLPPRRAKRSSRVTPWVIATAVLSVLLLGGLTAGGFYFVSQQASPATAYDGNKATTASEATVSDVIEKVSPSVVSIVTNTTKQTIYGASQAQAAGTGIIISSDGYILTNRHVIADASKVEVVLEDGTTYENVKVVGADPLNDVAYLKISDVSNLKAAQIGDSSTIRVGQQVIAIGNALGQYQNTVSSGIVSGKGRSLSASDEASDTEESLTDMLQTDAAINSGNSGGPLLNYAGQVIGINTAVATDATGIGFAIPINAAKGTMKNVIAGKGLQRAYIGIRYVDITPALAKQYNLSVTKGAYVTDDNQSGVQANSPATKAGIKDKDIITKVNNVDVNENNGFSSLIGQYSSGETITLTLLRDGKEQTIRVTLGTYSE